MSDKFTTGGIHLTTGQGPQASPVGKSPLKILVLGNFSGTQGGGTAEQEKAERARPILVDRDNFDDVMKLLQVEVELPSGETYAVSSLADFHPDQLLKQHPKLAPLAQLRRELHSPAKFEAAAKEVRSWSLLETKETSTTESNQNDTVPNRPATDVVADADPSDLLDQAIAQSESGTAPPSERQNNGPLSDELQALIQDSLAEIRIEKPAPERDDLVACVDGVTTLALRQVLHSHAFQELEATWRSLHQLVRQLRTGPDIQIMIVDLSKSTLAADLGIAKSLDESTLHRLLVQETVGQPGGIPWGLVLVNDALEATAVDLLLAGCLAKVAAEGSCPVVLGAVPEFVSTLVLADSTDPDERVAAKVLETWNSIRTMPEAKYLGLSLPRYLARLPYGTHSESIKAFAFEEIEPTMNELPTAELLWANTAYLAARLIGSAYTAEGWKFDLQQQRDVDGLPLYCFDNGIEEQLCPCTEVPLNYDAATQLTNAGFMPWLAVKNRGTVQLGAWNSVSAAGTRLAGRWPVT